MPKYKVWDTQLHRYFWGGFEFDTKEEAHATLIDYHSVDIEGVEDYTLEQICSSFDWKLEEIYT
jgi:hypothetical protein